ncbi:hypothetical protein [Mucilaginibacter sp. UR6-11]|uniref:hypothetical protein n=1 Tax=Mucilaginibacter sp. UR6-11 TaxID=1435644 RepID=UPI001E5382D0|nr:hypothetical protein [Mucilaginibacter sp. UR6-11]MCC8427026.1 hypothetical protein [Mucilaginibacter sp. UR6-11]
MTEQLNNNEPSQTTRAMHIVGINLGLLVAYFLLSRFTDGGILLYAMLIFVHVVTCIFTALVKRNWAWFFSCLLVLLIGFSTCVNFLKM